MAQSFNRVVSDVITLNTKLNHNPYIILTQKK